MVGNTCHRMRISKPLARWAKLLSITLVLCCGFHITATVAAGASAEARKAAAHRAHDLASTTMSDLQAALSTMPRAIAAHDSEQYQRSVFDRLKHSQSRWDVSHDKDALAPYSGCIKAVVMLQRLAAIEGHDVFQSLYLRPENYPGEKSSVLRHFDDGKRDCAEALRQPKP